MSHPIDSCPPWPEGMIAIPFAPDEWRYIAEVLDEDLGYHYGLITDKYKTMARNIIDRIEKGIGVE